MIRHFYIASLKHTRRDNAYITFWRPDNCGYAWPLPWSGKYADERVLLDQDYYNNGYDTIAVPCEMVDALAVPPVSGTVDNDAGPVVLNNRTNWKCIVEFAIEPPKNKPTPQYPGARRISA